MADASSARMASAGKTLFLVRRAHAELTNRDRAHTVLQDVGYRGPGCGVYLDLHMRLKQVFNTWRNWALLERKKLIDGTQYGFRHDRIEVLSGRRTKRFARPIDIGREGAIRRRWIIRSHILSINQRATAPLFSKSTVYAVLLRFQRQ